MLFSSVTFLFLFLGLVLAVHFVLPRRARNLWLLAVSLFFYAWGETVLVGLMLLSIASNWIFGISIERQREKGGGRALLVAGCTFNIGLLVLFKYADWIWTQIGVLLVTTGARDVPPEALGALLPAESMWRDVLLTADGHVRLPIGISFFSFHALSCLIDVWRRDARVPRNPLDYALYITLFPQLVAGPIVRYKDIATQIVSRIVTREGFASGIRRFVIGLSKKVLIANICARGCDGVFAIPSAELSSQLAWLGIVCYTLQIYFDFSGYSDMAIGLGRMFGFEFRENFAHPYISRSVTEFWRRWHISLSSWFRDYLYIPLGGNRGSSARTYTNLLIVFVLCGLWHGANVTFLIWGVYHGLYLVLERAFLGRALERVPALLRHAYLILVVMVGWVFFRADTLEQAWSLLGSMAGRAAPGAHLHPLDQHLDPVLLTAIVCGVIGSTPWLERALAWRSSLEQRGRVGATVALELAGLGALCVLFVGSAMELAGASYNPFIYFRF